MTTYEPRHYWRTRGETYEAKFRAARYVDQEATIRDALRSLQFASVLEVGCGFGRIGAIVADVASDAKYTGIDLSPTLLASAAARLPDGTFRETTLDDYRPVARTWDLVLAVEVLMHVLPVDMPTTIRKLLRLSKRYVLTVDWTEPVPKPAAHNFRHDYGALWADALAPTDRLSRRRVGLQTLYLIEKVRD